MLRSPAQHFTWRPSTWRPSTWRHRDSDGDGAAGSIRAARAQGSPLIRARALTVEFGTLRALDQVDLEIGWGEVVAVVGENGAGKTTLVKCIAGDTAPTSGRVDSAGLPVPVPVTATGRIAVLHQDVQLAENLDIAENLMSGLESGPLLGSRARVHCQAAAMLERLGITLGPGGPDRPVQVLSGGQRQMLALARALLREPSLLVLDEPTSSLAASESRWVEQLVRRLRGQGGSVLLCSHDIGQVLRLADRIVVLRHGAVVAELDPSTAHADARSHAAGLRRYRAVPPDSGTVRGPDNRRVGSACRTRQGQRTRHAFRAV